MITYSAPNVRKHGKAALASLRSYYFRMYVCNWRQHRREACESGACTAGQLRAWFRQATDIAKVNAYLSS